MKKYSADSLSLEQKMNLLTGRDGWSMHTFEGTLPKVSVSDGPNGLRMHKPDGGTYTAVAYPTMGALTNSWNRDLFKKVASLIAEECIEHDIQILLAPAVNIKRTPFCGRNFEYLSEDPYLAGTLAKEYIDGVQQKGVGTSLKHFAANNQEHDRLYVNNEIDERTLREIYFKVFEIALKAKPTTVMCSYNPLNGIYASENKKLLTDVLKKDFGFDGIVVSDWGAVNDRAKALKAGCELEMPHNDKAFDELKAAYDRGFITEEEINAAAARIVEVINRIEEMKPLRKIETNVEQRREAAKKACEESIVLLKNDGALPLKSTDKIAILGPYADNPPTSGGGSGKVECETRPEPLCSYLKQIMPDTTFFNNHHGGNEVVMFRSRVDIATAYNSDTAVICVGNTNKIESEGFDRYSLKLPEWMDEYILRVAKVCKNTVVVIHAGSYIDMSAWADKVQGIVFCGFCGQEVNHALANLLTGKACFSAKLSETFPLSSEDIYCRKELPSSFCEKYEEGINVGYRWYDTFEKEVRFPFGYGLSYANFEYSDLKVQKDGETDYTVSYKIKNTSDTDAAEISQVYVKDVFCICSRPEKELKGYSKDVIPAHGEKTVTIKLDKTAFEYYSTAIDGWYIENGDFEILVGASSRDIRLCAKVKVELPYDSQAKIMRER